MIQLLRYRQVVRYIPAKSVLADLGCGNGDFLRYMQARLTVGYGVDTKVSQTASAANLEFREGDLNKRIPLEDESVEIVTSLAVLEHLSEPHAFVKEIARVLRPGGACILTTPAPASKPLLEFLAYRMKIISANDIRDHKRYLGSQDLYALFKGFCDVRIRHFQLGLNTLIVAVKACQTG